MSLRVVDLPDPEWPVRKTNSPLRTESVTSCRAEPRFGYSLETPVSWINGRAAWREGEPDRTNYEKLCEPRRGVKTVFGEAHRQPQRFEHRGGVGAPRAGDVERRAVVGRGAHEGQPQRDVDAASEGDRLECRHADMVV